MRALGRLVALLLALVVISAPEARLFAADAKQRRFTSLEQATTALVDAADRKSVV